MSDAAARLAEIERLFERHGAARYSGEDVTQLEHALQSAHLAEAAGADDALVTACLLHDLGHLLADAGETPTLRGIDDGHEHVALPWLRDAFPPRVLAAIGLHVEAKRWLCHAEPGYLERLSPDSQRSLALQGGVFDARQAATFLARRGAADAIALRRFDDLAKQPGLPTPALRHFLHERAARCLRG